MFTTSFTPRGCVQQQRGVFCVVRVCGYSVSVIVHRYDAAVFVSRFLVLFVPIDESIDYRSASCLDNGSRSRVLRACTAVAAVDYQCVFMVYERRE